MNFVSRAWNVGEVVPVLFWAAQLPFSIIMVLNTVQETLLNLFQASYRWTLMRKKYRTCIQASGKNTSSSNVIKLNDTQLSYLKNFFLELEHFKPTGESNAPDYYAVITPDKTRIVIDHAGQVGQVCGGQKNLISQ